MRYKRQRGQAALPTVLVVMLVALLIAGSLAFVISAVIAQQRSNHVLISNDFKSQNAVAAAAADVSSGSCSGPTPAPIVDNFDSDTVSQLPSQWTSASTHWSVAIDSTSLFAPGQKVLTENSDDNPTEVVVWTGGPSWSDYVASAELKLDLSDNGAVDQLDARYMDSKDYYFLKIWKDPAGFGQLAIGKVANGTATTLSSSPIRFDSHSNPNRPWYAVRLELFGQTVSAFLDGKQMDSVVDAVNPIPAGGVAIEATGSWLGVDHVVAKQRQTLPTAQQVAPRSSGPAAFGFYCQRIDLVNRTTVGQQRLALSPAGTTCSAAGSATAPAAGADGHIYMWFTAPAANASLSLCHNGVAEDCSNQSSKTFTSSQSVTTVAAECVDQGNDTILVTGFPNGSAPLPQVTIRYAADCSDSLPLSCGDSVYMTAAATDPGDLTIRPPFEESDLILAAGSTILGYEGALG
jgi:hypothetical protein